MTDRNGRPLQPGDRVRILAAGTPRRLEEGAIIGPFPKDPQGFAGCITVDLGNEVHEYVPTSRLEKL
jgi:hypothetical protein